LNRLEHLDNLTLGPYRVIRHIASGGMSEILLCQRQGKKGFQKTVVAKLISKALLDTPKIKQMFLHEVQIHSRLCHPNVVQILDFGEIRDNYYMILEYVPGLTLRELIFKAKESYGSIPPFFALGLLREVLKGLHYVHSLKDKSGIKLDLVHRDISPENILISVDGSCKICDFGLAKSRLKSHDTQSGTIKGKLSYMSPEQHRGQKIDHRSDIFSAGACLFEMVSGSKLSGDTLNGDDRGLTGPQIGAHIRDLTKKVPTEIICLLERALARMAKERFQSAREFEIQVTRLWASLLTNKPYQDFEYFLHELFSKSSSRRRAARTKHKVREQKIKQRDKQKSLLKPSYWALFASILILIPSSLFHLLASTFRHKTNRAGRDGPARYS